MKSDAMVMTAQIMDIKIIEPTEIERSNFNDPTSRPMILTAAPTPTEIRNE